jgi:GT2 family glycosyltransferase
MAADILELADDFGSTLERGWSLTAPMEGHVDLFGYHDSASGMFFCGWLSHPWPQGQHPQNVVAHFVGSDPVEGSLMAFHHRDDVHGRGIGFIFFLACTSEPTTTFVHLEIRFVDFSHSIYPAEGAPRLRSDALADQLCGFLSGGEEHSNRQKMLTLLLRDSDAATRQLTPTASGSVDFYGYHAAAGGWLFCGWITDGWQEGSYPENVRICFEKDDIVGDATVVLYPRPDLTDGGKGIVVFVEGHAAPVGSLCLLTFEAAGIRATLSRAPESPRLREQECIGRLRPILVGAAPTLQRDTLFALLARQAYAGIDSLAGLSDRVFLEIDEAVLCEPDGLLLMGWFLAKRGTLRSMRLRCGLLITQLRPDEWIEIERPDVLAAVGSEHGYDDPRVGFIAFLPHSVVRGDRSYIELETARREVGFRNVPAPKLEGIAAIKRLLQSVDLRYTDVPTAFDCVLGPAIEMLNRSRLHRRPSVSVIEYGAIPANPKFSVIVPVYGRLDFVEYQLALLSAYPPNMAVEFLYVLDDPPKRKDAQFLFSSIYERFRIPFRALLLDRNVGFAPANNIGLHFARGSLVAFVNSDVFPGTPDWLERLAARLSANPNLGAIGPLLLFEDGSVQHQGMYFEALKEFGNWYFGQHSQKGLRYTGESTLQVCASITGACIVMERSLALRVGGFDEAYVIGDFEDSDLCLKLRAMGLECAVDPEVQLYHLERKSQASSALGWRMNLTLYNAWVHQRRWAAVIKSNLDDSATRSDPSAP